MSDVEKTISERHEIHGLYRDQCRVAENIKTAMRCSGNWEHLNPCQAQSLEMIAVKIARILTGDPDFNDHWHDIAGYATLAEKNPSLSAEEKTAKLNGDPSLDERAQENIEKYTENWAEGIIKKDIERWAEEGAYKLKEFLRNDCSEKTATNCRKHNET